MTMNKLMTPLVLMILIAAVQADKIAVVIAPGSVYAVDEFDLSAVGQISAYDHGKTITAAAGNADNGDLVLGFADGYAAVAKYYSLNSVITSGVVGDGAAVLGVSIRPNGHLYFGSAGGWVYARDRANVTAAPPNYTLPADMQIDTDSNLNIYPTSTILDEVIIVQNNLGKVFLRQGSNMAAVPASYLGDATVFGVILSAQLGLSAGNMVLASAAGTIFLRDNTNLTLVPAGIVGDGAAIGTAGAAITALARTKNDILLIGNNSGELFLRNADDLTEEPFPDNSYAAFPASIKSLAVTTNYSVVIGLSDGSVYVRSISGGIAGSDLAIPVNFNAPIVAVAAYPDPEFSNLSCAERIALGLVFTGDLNNECFVNFIDFAILVQDWLKCNDPQNVECQ